MSADVYTWGSDVRRKGAHLIRPSHGGQLARVALEDGDLEGVEEIWGGDGVSGWVVGAEMAAEVGAEVGEDAVGQTQARKREDGRAREWG